MFLFSESQDFKFCRRVFHINVFQPEKYFSLKVEAVSSQLDPASTIGGSACPEFVGGGYNDDLNPAALTSDVFFCIDDKNQDEMVFLIDQNTRRFFLHKN